MVERARIPNGHRLAEVRNGPLAELWKNILTRGGAKGRVWGPRGEKIVSGLYGSQIFFAQERESDGAVEVVLVFENQEGHIVVRELEEAEDTQLGKEIRSLLKESGF